MYRPTKNMLKGRKKIKDERGTSINYSGGYAYSLSQFLERLKREREETLVIWRETLEWKPCVKFSWNKPQIFSPQEAADYVERRKLLSDNWNYFESRWQIYSSKSEEQHYFDIDIYHTTFPMGSLEVGELKHKVTLECLLTK